MPEAKKLNKKMQGFDDVLFTMMSFSAKKSGKKQYCWVRKQI